MNDLEVEIEDDDSKMQTIKMERNRRRQTG
jgi:hypothetical protein